MEKLKRLLLCLSLLFCTLCFGASVWMVYVLGDTASWSMAVILFCSVVWLGINVWKMFRGGED